ncbi:hypothetical protein ACWGH2_41785 [Streptomyces sp. NPDC054871]
MSEVIECKAFRRGRDWVVHVPEHQVYGYGKTLKRVRENVERGLALVGVTAEVQILAVTPELEKLRAAKDACAAALTETVTAMALRRATLGDIALATGEPTRRVKAIITASRPEPQPTTPANTPSSGFVEDAEERHATEHPDIPCDR